MIMALKDMLPKELYELQKELFKEIIDGGKKVLKKKSSEIYILQKEVFADLQKAVVAEAKEKAKEIYVDKFDSVCDVIKQKIPFVGRIIASLLRKYKKEILEAIL
jgi:hypothetical protein